MADDDNDPRQQRPSPPPDAVASAHDGQKSDDEDENEIDYENLDLSFDDLENDPELATSAYTSSELLLTNGQPPASAAADTAASKTDEGNSNDDPTDFRKPPPPRPPSSSNDGYPVKSSKTGGGGGGDDDNYWTETHIVGTLVVRVVAAQNLHVRQRPRHQDGGVVHPYASVRFGSIQQRTSQLYHTSHPVWPRDGETMYMDVVHPELEPQDHHHEEPASAAAAAPKKAAAGDPPLKRSTSTASSSSSSRQSLQRATRKAMAESHAYGVTAYQPHNGPTTTTMTDPYQPAAPLLTLAVFHNPGGNSSSNKEKQLYNPSKTGDSDDVFLGMAVLNVTPVLTGQRQVLDVWLPLQGGGDSSIGGGGRKHQRPHDHHHYSLAQVRVICEYDALDEPPRRGDLVRFSRYCAPRDLFPANYMSLYQVEEDSVRNPVTQLHTTWISATTPEGWLTSFCVPSHMLIVTQRHDGGPVDFASREWTSLQTRLSHSPLLHTVQGTLDQVQEGGIVDVGAQAWRGTTSTLGRWFASGWSEALQDVAFATNWDGQHNPNLDDDSDNDDDGGPSHHSETERAVGRAQDDAPAPAMMPLEATLGLDRDDQDSGRSRQQEQRTALPNMPACPITGEAMRDPVVAADGHTYERDAIARWLQTSDKSPLTGAVLPHKNLVPNYMLLSSLQEYFGTTTTTSSSSSSPAPSPASTSAESEMLVLASTNSSTDDDEDLVEEQLL